MAALQARTNRRRNWHSSALNRIARSSSVARACGAVFAFALFFTLASGTATASPTKLVTVNLTATVAEVYESGNFLCSNVTVGDTITASYTYNTKARDSNAASFVGDYDYSTPPNGIWVDLGDATTGTDASAVAFYIETVNDYPGDGSDALSVSGRNNTALTCGSPVEFINWQLDDPTGAAFSDTSIPPGAPNIGMFESIFGLTLSARDGEGSTGFFIRAHVTEATTTCSKKC